jgi:hypothetical protein
MLTRTCTILSAAIFLGTASAALAMSPTGSNYKPFAKAYAPPHPVHRLIYPLHDQYGAHDGNGENSPVLIRPYWDNGYFRNF